MASFTCTQQNSNGERCGKQLQKAGPTKADSKRPGSYFWACPDHKWQGWIDEVAPVHALSASRSFIQDDYKDPHEKSILWRRAMVYNLANAKAAIEKIDQLMADVPDF